MHYANGRVAKNGDRVIRIAGSWSKPVVGILHDAVASNDHCNGSLASPINDAGCINLAECLHVDDLTAAVGDIKAVKDLSIAEPVAASKVEEKAPAVEAKEPEVITRHSVV